MLGSESFARGGLTEHRYRDSDVCDHAFGVFEGDSSSKGPSVQAFGMNFATGYLRPYLIFIEFFVGILGI